MTDDVSTPTTAMIVRPSILPSLAQFGIERDLAIRLASARGFLPDHYFLGTPIERAAKVLAAIEYGRAVGIEPMIALQNITMIKGKAGASALLIGAQLRRAGYEITTAWFDQQGVLCEKRSPGVWGCEVTLTKNSKKTGDGAFSMTDAQRAGLVKADSGWANYPKDMLYARALTQAAREGAQDAVLGMAYTADELGAEVDYDGNVEIVNPPGMDPWAASVIEGEVVPAVTPGVSEAAGSQPAAAIQPTPPAVPPAEGAEPTIPASGPATGNGGAAPAGGTSPVVGDTVPPPPAVPFNPAPLSGPSVSRRMGRSVGPAPKRTNVVEVTPGAEKPATAPEVPPQSQVSAEIVSSQPTPPALTDEPLDAAPAPPVVDEGEQVYLAQQREILRQAAATLSRLNIITKNHLVHALKGEDPEVIPPAEPNPTSDEQLKGLIERDYPGRTLATLGVEELQNRLELIAPFIDKRRAALKEKGITEE